jgi:hypothetical protein
MIIKRASSSHKRGYRKKTLSEWHTWFAWYPVRINSLEVVWLQSVKRKVFSFNSYGSILQWQFKL